MLALDVTRILEKQKPVADESSFFLPGDGTEHIRMDVAISFC